MPNHVYMVIYRHANKINIDICILILLALGNEMWEQIPWIYKNDMHRNAKNDTSNWLK